MRKFSFNLVVQGPFEPKVTKLSNFVAVRIAGMDDAEAEVFVTTKDEAEKFIAAFTEARDLL